MKIKEVVKEDASAVASGVGSIAPIVQPMGVIITRSGSTSKDNKYTNEIKRTNRAIRQFKNSSVN